MTPELKQKWIKALKSGEYKKGQGILRDRDDTYCCLGVLCDVAGFKWEPYNMTKSFSTEYGETFTLSADNLVKFGITPELESVLMAKNDDNDTWDVVIQAIENNL